MSSGLPFTAIALPGDRLPHDPPPRAAGIPGKALPGAERSGRGASDRRLLGALFCR
jgi:hypothetical protein